MRCFFFFGLLDCRGEIKLVIVYSSLGIYAKYGTTRYDLAEGCRRRWLVVGITAVTGCDGSGANREAGDCRLRCTIYKRVRTRQLKTRG